MQQEKHVFALYIDNLLQIIKNAAIVIDDVTMMHRITQVLRLQVDDELILFDRSDQVYIRLTEIHKKNIISVVISQRKNLSLKPFITLLLPLLKKDALSEAVYNAVESGASEIQLIYTQKAQRVVSDHELERLERVIIAAAEQSKHFHFPVLKKPKSFIEAIRVSNALCIFFDPHGISMQTYKQKNADALLCLLIGPEGDLTGQEKQLIYDTGWQNYALTPTILRASQAVAVGIGVVRSLSR